MSQRALKKREHNLLKQEKETHQIYRKQAQPLSAQQKSPKYTQRTANNSIICVVSKSSVMKPYQIDKSRCSISASKLKFHSTPNLAAATTSIASSSMSSILPTADRRKHNRIFRSHSENDLSCMPDEANVLVNAKSEFHLQSISSTQFPTQGFQSLSTITSDRSFNQTKQNVIVTKPMITQPQNQYAKRMSIHSGHSSHTSGSLTSSASNASTQSANVGFGDRANIRIPIVGYEVMEERARFTVYKLRIENPFTNDCWLVLRRYTDFQRLNNKLKMTFPHLPPLTLPRKKLFGDNFNSLFLSNRVQGLQLYVNTLIANEIYRNSKPVRDFFCLDNPPTYSDSIEECRAIFEAQEDTINHLKMQLRTKDELILSMQQQLDNEIEKNHALSAAINYSYENCDNCSKRFDELMKCQTVISK